MGNTWNKRYRNVLCVVHQNIEPLIPTNFPDSLIIPKAAECTVQTVTSILNKVTDPYLRLLSYWVTLLANGYFPAEVLMGRKLCPATFMLAEIYKPIYHHIPRYS